MAYLSFWAAGKLRCFNGGGHPWRLVVSGAPTGLAAWVGFTRLQASWEVGDGHQVAGKLGGGDQVAGKLGRPQSQQAGSGGSVLPCPQLC